MQNNHSTTGTDFHFLMLLILFAVAVVTFTGIAAEKHAGAEQAPPTVAACHEEDPCWDPATMGNHCWGEPNAEMPSGYEVICAPAEIGDALVIEPAESVVVTPKFTG